MQASTDVEKVIRALPAPLSLPWRTLGIAAWLIVNGVLIAYTVGAFLLRPGAENDWGTWTFSAEAVHNGTLYTDGIFVWSPIAAWLLGPVVALGYWFWFAAHVAVLGLLRDRWLIGLTLTSWPFWIDTVNANFFVFVAVAGFLAVRGSRPAAIAFIALCLLMPRPVQLPLALWLLYRDRRLWPATVAMTLVSLILVALSGWGDEWLGVLLDLSHAYPFRGWDIGPTRFLGSTWLIVGVPLAGWLLYRGRVGWAGMALSPYLVPQYLLVALWELVSKQRQQHDRHVGQRVVHEPVGEAVKRWIEGPHGALLLIGVCIGWAVLFGVPMDAWPYVAGGLVLSAVGLIAKALLETSWHYSRFVGSRRRR